MTAAPPPEIAGLVDFARYPVHDPAGEGAKLAERCRRELAETGASMLEGFITPSGVARMAAEGMRLASKAWRTSSHGTAYLDPPDESFPESHPKRRLQSTSVGAVAYDLIPAQDAIRRVYEWDALADWLAQVIGCERVYRYADPLGALNVAVMEEGERLLWHFDQTDFVVSSLLQDCERGGDFEYVPHIRTPEEPNYDRIERLLDGERDGVVTLDMKPGTMALFMGRYSIHRVTAVEGSTPRLVALLGYDTRPGIMSSDHLKLRRYGRTEPIPTGP
ncbi:MAG: hypothetical protein IRZ04_04845 [Rhodospirillales bacterium]|nr:hypothetical protein [Rhodospirillales bacterium]